MKRIHFMSTSSVKNSEGTLNIFPWKDILKHVLPMILILSLFSCEKIIQLDLKNSTPKIVIQGNIYDQPGPFTIKISNSAYFDASNNYPPVTGAKVVITDNVNQTEQLTESTSGTYVTSKLRGIQGRIYSLSVKNGNDTYLANSVMPYAVSIDSIYFANSLFSDEKVTMIRFRDPPFTTNYYRLVYFINNIKQKQFYVISDEFLQGATIFYSLQARNSNIKLAKNDLVTVWLESVDKGVYEYFRTAGNDDENSASPSNPVSNISNDALGYFNASTIRKISATVDK
ncbi:MAG: DUF4249 domain-containing protein [Prolixibacteraceae bacterium]